MKKKPRRNAKKAPPPEPFTSATVAGDDGAAVLRFFQFIADYQRALDVALGAGHPPTRLTGAQTFNEAKRLQRARDTDERTARAREAKGRVDAERRVNAKKELLDAGDKPEVVIFDRQARGLRKTKKKASRATLYRVKKAT